MAEEEVAAPGPLPDGAGTVVPHGDAVASSGSRVDPVPDGTVEHSESVRVREERLTAERINTLQMCQAELSEIEILLTIMSRAQYPPDRFTAFLRSTADGTRALVAILNANSNSLDRDLAKLCAAAEASRMVIEAFRFSFQDKVHDGSFAGVFENLARKAMGRPLTLPVPVTRHRRSEGAPLLTPLRMETRRTFLARTASFL